MGQLLRQLEDIVHAAAQDTPPDALKKLTEDLATLEKEYDGGAWIKLLKNSNAPR
jgi:hypothetical protein